jgi:hypothetical protein
MVTLTGTYAAASCQLTPPTGPCRGKRSGGVLLVSLHVDRVDARESYVKSQSLVSAGRPSVRGRHERVFPHRIRVDR